jgi:ATP-dependent helicase/nuclease subunit A
VRLTPEQERAATESGSLAVTAGAGTGKTHMLAARYLHHLREGLSPLEIVAVTFTEKAAAELRARIRQEVAESFISPQQVAFQAAGAGGAQAGGPGAGGFGAARLAEVEAAPISTLHALAARICREHPQEAGVASGFAILDELEGPLWTVERLDACLDQLPAAALQQIPYSLARAALEAFLGDPLMAEQALERDPSAWPELIAAARDEALRELVADPEWQRAGELLSRFSGSAGDAREEARGVALQAVLDLESGAAARPALEALSGVSLRGGSKKQWPDGGFEEVTDALKLLRERVRIALKEGLVALELGPADDRLAAMLSSVRDLYRQVRERMEQAKRQSRALDYSDLEVHALRALEQPAVRRYCHERWRAFLVDEFQDTNPVQAMLLDRLTEEAIVTLVGDEKQSIYGFRRADATVFRRFRAQVVGRGGVACELALSFRAHAELVTTCNSLFRPVLGELHQELRGHRETPPHAGPHVQLHLVSAGHGLKEDRRRLEAARMASLLRAFLETGLLIHDRHSDQCRPVRPGDIAILSRAWEPLDSYGEALAAARIPTVHMGGGSLLSTREAKDGWVLLRFLADPDDDLALAAVLRSPFFAVGDDDLLRFAESLPDPRPHWWPALGVRRSAIGIRGPDSSPIESGVAREPQSESSASASIGAGALWAGRFQSALQRAAEALAELLRAGDSEPPSRLLQLADRCTGYTAVIANLAGGGRRMADWRGFEALVRQLESGGSDLFTVVRRLRRLQQAEIDVPRPRLEAADAVTLMTIHGAKGLEWPVVVIPDLTRRGQNKSPRVLFDPEIGVGLRLADEEGAVQKPALFTLLEARQRRREEAEARRLLYVAATRARDRLLLTAPDDRGGLLDLLQPGLAASGVACVTIPTDLDLSGGAPPEPPLPPPAEQVLTEPAGQGPWFFEGPQASAVS